MTPVDGLPASYLLCHSGAGAKLSVATGRGDHKKIGDDQLTPLLRNADLHALCAVPGTDNEYVAWDRAHSFAIHFKVVGLGGSARDLEFEDFGRFPVPYPKHSGEGEKPKNLPMSFALYKEGDAIEAVYHSPGGAGNVAKWTARMKLRRNLAKAGRLEFDDTVVPAFGTLGASPKTTNCISARSRAPAQIFLTGSGGNVYKGNGARYATLEGHNLRCLYAGSRGVDAFDANGQWIRLTNKGADVESKALKIGSVTGAAPILASATHGKRKDGTRRRVRKA